jgi:tetratricopeptide (TPR) repeat protein
MKTESLVYAAAGTLFGLIVGWILGAQQVAGPSPAAPPVAQAQPAGQATAPQTPKLDQAEVQKYLQIAAADPDNVTPKVNLGNLYFDAERYDDAVQWYEAALRLDPTNADVSTDLGVSFYYLNDSERALAQFDKSLKIDPKHVKTLLNVGIVRAFGKQDLAGAARTGEQVIAIAPQSPEGQAAKRALDAMKGAHPGLPAGGASAPSPGAS